MSAFNYSDVLIRLLYNGLTAFIIIRFVYFPRDRRPEYLFTFLIFNQMIFFVCTFLKYIMMDIGFAFGLFAIFSILRYRTESIPIREMTYQFLVITLGALNGLVSHGSWHPELLAVNLFVLIAVVLLDGHFLNRSGSSQTVRYEKIELIRPDRRNELISDLKIRTGLNVTAVQINGIDFMRDSADLVVFYQK